MKLQKLRSLYGNHGRLLKVLISRFKFSKRVFLPLYFKTIKDYTWYLNPPVRLPYVCNGLKTMFASMRDFKRYPKICCIYFMFLKGKLIYIGQTVDLACRMSGHTYEYQHDCIRWIECPEDKLKHYEKRLIRILKPVANYTYNTDNPNRMDLTYKTPLWVWFYNQMRYYSTMLDTGDYRCCRTTLENEVKIATSKFMDAYHKHGFKDTFLDPLANPLRDNSKDYKEKWKTQFTNIKNGYR